MKGDEGGVMGVKGRDECGQKKRDGGEGCIKFCL